MAAWVLLLSAHAEIRVKNGETVVFLGDSITKLGWDKPTGYIHLVVEGLAANGITVEAVPAGMSGNASNNMLARLDRDVFSKSPQWVTLNCGVNDILQGAKGNELEPYEKNITSWIAPPRPK